MRRLALIAALILCCTATPATAAKPTPGSSCVGQNTGAFTTSGGQETGGILYFLVCDGANWQPIETFDHADHNAAIGYGVIFASGGSNNVAIGDLALHNSTGSSSIAIGQSADYNLITGGHEIAIGTQALFNSTYGYNIGIGYGALFGVAGGSNNISIGVNSGGTLTTGTNNIIIGSGSFGGAPLDVPATNTSNFLNIGNAIFATGMTGTLAAPAGNVGIGTTGPATKLDVNGDITNENVKSCATLGTDSTGKLICQTPAMVLISTQTASASASLQWTGIGSSYHYYKLFCTDLILSSTSAILYLQFGEGGTPTWKTSSYEYAGNICPVGVAGSTGCSGYDSASATGVIMSNGSPETWGSQPESIDLTISNPASALYKYVNGSWTQYSNHFSLFLVSGEYTGDTTAVTAFRLSPSTGTITSGTCSLYGIN